MNLRTVTTRAAVAGVTTALAAAGLVGVTGTAANAVSNTTAYVCDLTSPIPSPLGSFDLMVDTPVVPAEGTAGQSFPGGLLAFTSALTIPAEAAGPLMSYGITGGDTADYAAHVGPTTIGAPMTFDAPTMNEDGSATMLGGGANTPFTLPGAGTYDIALPDAFTFIAHTTAFGDATIACATEDAGALGEITLSKGASSIAATSKSGKVNVTVDRGFDDVVPAGKVTAKLGKKTWTEKLDNKGKAVFKLPASAKGKKVTISYKGDKYTSAADSIKVLVK